MEARLESIADVGVAFEELALDACAHARLVFLFLRVRVQCETNAELRILARLHPMHWTERLGERGALDLAHDELFAGGDDSTATFDGAAVSFESDIELKERRTNARQVHVAKLPLRRRMARMRTGVR